MSKSSAAVYAQLRRDNESSRREALRALVPCQYFTHEVTENGDFNITTKVLVASTSYLEDIQSAARGGSQKSKVTMVGPTLQVESINSDPEVESARSITLSENFRASKLRRTLLVGPEIKCCTRIDHEELQHLRQVTSRLIQKVDEKISGHGTMTRMLKGVIERTCDLLIDTIETLERLE